MFLEGPHMSGPPVVMGDTAMSKKEKKLLPF